MTNPTDQPSSITAAIFGEKAAAKLAANAAAVQAQADAEARHDRLRKNVSSVFFVLFVLGCVFGTAMGCLAMWNAVVG